MTFDPQSYWGFVSAILFLKGTLELSKSSLSRLVAMEYNYKERPELRYRMLGYLCGIKSKHDSHREFMGGTWEDIKRNTDADAVIRGLVWNVVGFITLILSIFGIGPVFHLG